MESVLGFGGGGRGFGFFPPLLHLFLSSLVFCSTVGNSIGDPASCPLFQLLQNFSLPSLLDMEQCLAKCSDLEDSFQY